MILLLLTGPKNTKVNKLVIEFVKAAEDSYHKIDMPSLPEDMFLINHFGKLIDRLLKIPHIETEIHQYINELRNVICLT